MQITIFKCIHCVLELYLNEEEKKYLEEKKNKKKRSLIRFSLDCVEGWRAKRGSSLVATSYYLVKKKFLVGLSSRILNLFWCRQEWIFLQIILFFLYICVYVCVKNQWNENCFFLPFSFFFLQILFSFFLFIKLSLEENFQVHTIANL